MPETIVQFLQSQSKALNPPSRNRDNHFIRNGGIIKNASTEETETLNVIRRVLEHSTIGKLIDKGKFTFGMIRPRLELGNYPEKRSDQDIADEIEERVRKTLTIAFKAHVKLSLEDVQLFYSEIEQKLRGIEATEGLERFPGDNVWDAFTNYVASGTNTLMVLYIENASDQADQKAFNVWREIIGPTMPKNAPRGTIRGDYGNAISNIVHGSDSTEAVHREVQTWLPNMLKTHPIS